MLELDSHITRAQLDSFWVWVARIMDWISTTRTWVAPEPNLIIKIYIFFFLLLLICLCILALWPTPCTGRVLFFKIPFQFNFSRYSLLRVENLPQIKFKFSLFKVRRAHISKIIATCSIHRRNSISADTDCFMPKSSVLLSTKICILSWMLEIGG